MPTLSPPVRVLLADDDAPRAGALANMLETDSNLTVLRLRPGELLADAVVQCAPDIVLIDMTRPDRDALDGIRQVSARVPRPIVLFVDQDDPAFMEEAIAAGVLSYNVPGMKPPDVKPILRAAMALFQHYQRGRDRLHRAEARLQERETIDRAKAILIKERRMDEPDAYRWLRTQAMSRGRKIVDVAHDLVQSREGDGA